MPLGSKIHIACGCHRTAAMAPLEDQVPVGQTSSPKVFTGMEKVGGLMLKKSVFHENGEKQAPGAECVMDPTFFLRHLWTSVERLSEESLILLMQPTPWKKFLGKSTRYRQNSIFLRPMHCSCALWRSTGVGAEGLPLLAEVD